MNLQCLIGVIDWCLILLGGFLPVLGPVLLTWFFVWIGWFLVGKDKFKEWLEFRELINPSGWLFYAIAASALSFYTLVTDSPIEDEVVNIVLAVVAALIGAFGSPSVLAAIIILTKTGGLPEDHPKPRVAVLAFSVAVSAAALRLTLLHLQRLA